MIALGAAVFLGLLAVFLANSFLLGAERRNELRGSTKVAVAAIPLEYGTDVTRDKVRFVDFPNASIPPGSFTDINKLLPAGKRRVALLTIQAGEPILANKLSGEGQGASIAALLPDGKRAAAVRINDVSGVAGFIRPNDAVDVLVTRQVPGGSNNQQLTDVLLQNARVIAIDQDATREDGKPVVAKTATLEVDPLDAQKLALAQEVGSLSLVLRKPGDAQNNPLVETVSLDDLRYNLYGGVRYPQGIPPAAAVSFRPAMQAVVRPAAQPRRAVRHFASVKARPRTNTIEIVRGTEHTNYEVASNGR